MRKEVCTMACMILVGIIAGTFLMLLTYALPVEKMEEHVFESTYIFVEEGRRPLLIQGDKYVGTSLDNYTDAIMLNNAIYNGQEPLVDRAMNVWRKEYVETADTCESLIEYAKGTEGYYLQDYPRYWHGYLVFLKPLLLFFNYKQIRIINLIIQLFLALSFFIELFKKKIYLYVGAFAISAVCLLPLGIPLSLQLASCGYILLIALLILIKKFDYFEQYHKVNLFFCVIGMMTSFIDFLTYPPVTLGFPLVLFTVLSKKGWKEQTIKNLKCMIAWVAGYGGMWAGKWVVSSVLLKKNIIMDAVNSIGIRTGLDKKASNFGEEFNYFQVLKGQFNLLNNAIGKSMLIVAILMLIGIALYQQRKCFDKVEVTRVIPYLLVGSLTFIWYYIAMNHVYIHVRFTFRIAVVAILAVLCGIISLRQKSTEEFIQK